MPKASPEDPERFELRGAQSPNKSLQRSADHKVLGRGRGLANLVAIAPRPRADTSARGR